MSAATEAAFTPNALNKKLVQDGVSKTVYALVTPEAEAVKMDMLQSPEYLRMFRAAWTNKQDAAHEDFFRVWAGWASPVVDLDVEAFPYQYPTGGASEALRHLIYQRAADDKNARIHFFEGEYEGYMHMALAAGLKVVQHKRNDDTLLPHGDASCKIAYAMEDTNDLFCISQPSAIDGNVWRDFNEFVSLMPANSVIADVTYVGAVPRHAVEDRFNLNAPAIRNVVFSLSKPFGVYYDRVGGVWSREEDAGLFGNQWFKNLTSLELGTRLLEKHHVFDLPERYAEEQEVAVKKASKNLGFKFEPADVFVLGICQLDGDFPIGARQDDLVKLLTRAEGKMRLCLTPMMAKMIGTA